MLGCGALFWMECFVDALEHAKTPFRFTEKFGLITTPDITARRDMKKQKLHNNEPSYARYHLSRWFGESLGEHRVGKDTIQHNGETLYYYDCHADGTTVWYDRGIKNLYYQTQEE